MQIARERAAMNEYLDNYNLFCRVCKQRDEDISPMELTILHHGYATGGIQNVSNHPTAKGGDRVRPAQIQTPRNAGGGSTMRLQLNGQIYDIPKGVRLVRLQLARSHTEVGISPILTGVEKFEIAREENKEILKDFNYLGFEEIDKKTMCIEVHWFVHHLDLGKCTISREYLQGRR
jgi:hypothetical protein